MQAKFFVGQGVFVGYVSLGRVEGTKRVPEETDMVAARWVDERFPKEVQKIWNRYGFTSVLAISPDSAVPVLQALGAGKGGNLPRPTFAIRSRCGRGRTARRCRPTSPSPRTTP